MAVALIVAVEGWTTYLFSDDGRWVCVALFGVALALGGLAEWYFIRQRSCDARYAADRLLFAFSWALFGIGMVLESAQERERALEEQCIRQVDSATETPEVSPGRAP